MGAIALLTGCIESIVVIVSIFLGHKVPASFYVTAFLELFIATWFTLYGLNKVRKGTKLLRTLFCLVMMMFLMWLSYTLLQGALQAGISKLSLDILNPSWEMLKKNFPIVAISQFIIFVVIAGWGLTDVNANVFDVF